MISSAQHQCLSAEVDTVVLTSAEYESLAFKHYISVIMQFLPVVNIILFFQILWLSSTDQLNTKWLLRHPV